MSETIKLRFKFVVAFFVLIIFVMIARLAYLQIYMGAYYDNKSQNSLPNERIIRAARGNILDRNGVPIAVNRQGFTVQIIKTKMDNQDLNSMLLKLVELFEKNSDTYYKTLTRYLSVNGSSIDFGSNLKINSGDDAKTKKSKEDLQKKWIKSNVVLKEEDINELNTPADIFNYLRNKRFKIDSKYDNKQAFKIMVMRYELMVDNFNVLTPIPLATDVSKETVAEVEEKSSEFPGVTTDVEPIRKYVDAVPFAHILGYVGPIFEEEYKANKDKGYLLNDVIGKTGIEKYAEDELRGKNGLKKVQVDKNGRVVEDLTQEQPAVSGKDVVLTIDANLQKVAMNSLQTHINEIRNSNDKGNKHDAVAGSAVAMDVNTGEVLALASFPSYDPSIFLEGADNKAAQSQIDALFKNTETRPAIFRAVMSSYAPGSTFKPLTAIAALQENVITTSNNVINDPGYLMIGPTRYLCLERPNYGHGNLSLTRAIETSCNIYFYKLGLRLGIDKISKWAKIFGLGQKTGIEIPDENKGYVASKNVKSLFYPKEGWYDGDTAGASIGQSFNSYTPLQLVNYISSIANGGKKVQPHIIKRYLNPDGTVYKDTKVVSTPLPVSKENIDAVKAGMLAVTTGYEGTAKGLWDKLNTAGIDVAGKTGTAETGNEANHSSNALFVCFAPAKNPQIAVAVTVEKGVWGANTAPIARDILEEYFGINKPQTNGDGIEIPQTSFSH